MNHETDLPGAEQLPGDRRLLSVGEVLVALEDLDKDQSSKTYEEIGTLEQIASHGDLVYAGGFGMAHIHAKRLASLLEDMRASSTLGMQTALASVLYALRLRASEEVAEASTVVADLAAKYAGSLYVGGQKDEDPKPVRGLCVLSDELNIGVITDEHTQDLSGGVPLYIDISCLDADVQDSIQQFNAEQES